MPYPSNLSKITWGGTAYNNAEIWQCGLHMSGTKVPGSPEMAPIIKALQEWMKAQHQTHRLTWVKWAELNPEGRYASDASPVLRDMDVLGTREASSSTTPIPQLTVAITLLTDRKRGGGARGRLYPPPASYSMTPDGLIHTAEQSSQVTRHLALIKAFNTAADGFFGTVVVASKGGKKTQPAIEPVTAISVGRVVDTQRRRRNSLVEAPTRVPLT